MSRLWKEVALCLRDKKLLRGYGVDEFLAFKKSLPHKSGIIILPYYTHATHFFLIIVGLAKCLQHVATVLSTQQAITEWDKGVLVIKVDMHVSGCVNPSIP